MWKISSKNCHKIPTKTTTTIPLQTYNKYIEIKKKTPQHLSITHSHTMPSPYISLSISTYTQIPVALFYWKCCRLLSPFFDRKMLLNFSIRIYKNLLFDFFFIKILFIWTKIFLKFIKKKIIKNRFIEMDLVSISIIYLTIIKNIS